MFLEFCKVCLFVCLSFVCVGVLLDHFTVVCPVTWPLNGREVAGDLVLIRPHCFCCINQAWLVFIGQVTKHTTVKQ